MQQNEIREVFPDESALIKAAAQKWIVRAKNAVADHGFFAVALSGGSSPKGLYKFLATDPTTRDAMPWAQTHFFFGDERHVPPDSPESNFRMAKETMLDHLSLERSQIHRVLAELPDANDAARNYAAELERFFGERPLIEDGFPQFDLMFLGLGPDGHTASLFPGTPALQETRRWVVANWVEKLDTFRITMTFPVLNHSSEVMVYVTGHKKASIVADVLERNTRTQAYPIQKVVPIHAPKNWMMDQSAASLLTPRAP